MSRRLFPKNVAEKHDSMTAVIQSDARNLPLPDKCVDLIVTSPPYFTLRSYKDDGEHFDQIGGEETPQEFVDALSACMVEWRRLLKPGGSIWVNLGDKYAGSGGHNNSNIGIDPTRGPKSYNKGSSGVRAKSLMGLPWRFANAQIDAGWILRAEVIWDKPNGLPESVQDRVRRSHEQWFHFTKESRYYSSIDEIRQPHKSASIARQQRGQIVSEGNPYRGEDTGQTAHTLIDDQMLHDLGRLPSSVWRIPTEPLHVPPDVQAELELPDHFAAFPQEWPRRIIRGWSPNGICVQCGEGRKPLVDSTPSVIVPSARRAEGHKHGIGSGRTSPSGAMTQMPYRAIIGEQCACDKPSAPTMPAIVLDPLGGTGTVAGVARMLGRYGISNDLSADYNRLAVWRIWDSGQFEKSHEKWLAEKDAGQPSALETYLMSFPGVGRVSAHNIVNSVGNPFQLSKDITAAKGVGATTVDKINDVLEGRVDSEQIVGYGTVQPAEQPANEQPN